MRVKPLVDSRNSRIKLLIKMFKIFVVCLFSTFFINTLSLGCVDEHGKEVSYWIALRVADAGAERQMLKYDGKSKIVSLGAGEGILEKLLSPEGS